MEIRPYRNEYLSAVVELWRAAFPDEPLQNDPATDIARDLEVMGRPLEEPDDG